MTRRCCGRRGHPCGMEGAAGCRERGVTAVHGWALPHLQLQDGSARHRAQHRSTAFAWGRGSPVPAALQPCTVPTLQPCTVPALHHASLAALHRANPEPCQPCSPAPCQPCNPATLQPYASPAALHRANPAALQLLRRASPAPPAWAQTGALLGAAGAAWKGTALWPGCPSPALQPAASEDVQTVPSSGQGWGRGSGQWCLAGCAEQLLPGRVCGIRAGLPGL